MPQVRCEPIEGERAEKCPQEWLNVIYTNAVRQQECIKSWESAAEAHNAKAD